MPSFFCLRPFVSFTLANLDATLLLLHGTPPPPLGFGRVPFRGGHRGLHCNLSPGVSSVGCYEGVVRNSPMYIFISSGAFVVAFANSQCIMDACLFLNSLERVPFRFTMASRVVYIYFPSCCNRRPKFFFLLRNVLPSPVL